MERAACDARRSARFCGLVLVALCALACEQTPARAQGFGVRAWGVNVEGTLGIGASAATYSSATPVRVKASPGGDALTNVVQIAAGSAHTVAVKADGTVWAWGANTFGQLGNGTTTNSSLPVQVMLAAGTPLRNVTSVGAGYDFSFAVVGTTVYAWGDNSSGDLGNTALGIYQSAVTYPVKVSLPATSYPGTVTVVGGDGFALALRTVTVGSGIAQQTVRTLYAWGDNYYGELGEGQTSEASATPVPVSLGGNQAVAVAAGTQNCLAIDTSGNVWAWGDNTHGESGTTGGGLTTTPTQVPGINGAVQVATNGGACFAITHEGTLAPALWAWGHNFLGQLGVGILTTGGPGEDLPTPTVSEIPTGPSGPAPVAVSAGYMFTYVAMSDGTVWAAGENTQGQLGNGNLGEPVEYNSAIFQQVTNISGATAVAAGGSTGFALTNDFKFVWQDTLTGITPYWDFGSTSGIANTYEGHIGYFLNPDYRIAAALDLFSDGNRDLLLQSRTTGALAYLQMSGANVTGGGLIPAAPSYSPGEVVVGTMNINNGPAIVWQNTTTGEVDYWTMGLQTVSGVLTPVSTGGGRIVAPGSYTWQVAAAYPAGGENWIIWHDISNDATAGELIYQPVSTSGSYLPGSGLCYQHTVPAGWSLHVEDVNGDGNPDFIWHDGNGSQDPASGQTYIWLMNGPAPTFTSSQQVSGMGSGQVSIPVDYYIGAIL